MTNKNIDDKALNNVVGGHEPEEFEWNPKGYVTPIKEDQEGLDFVFKPIGDLEKIFENVTGGQNIDEDKNNIKIVALMKVVNSTNQDIINMIIEALQKYGVKAALNLTDKLFANDETYKKIIEDIIKS